ncbi:MAG: (d)CMP kinase [Oscillospiraceae bacterium]|nr:(d)CMP kinase [Oscillospiraceae bacterium]
MYQIAIDGPTGAGKSTVSKALAQQLGFIYVDTGALYRSIGYTALQAGVDVYESAEVEILLKDISIELKYISKQQHVLVNSQDLTNLIRTEDVSMAASAVSAHIPVRAFLLQLQRTLAERSNVIMDGRDIGTVVLPNADVKIFLTASDEVRALRRMTELQRKGIDAIYEEVLRDLRVRDSNDSNREAAPLKAADDAVVVDSTNMSFDEIVEYLIDLIKERLHI